MNWYIQALKNAFDFKGRARRPEYWYFSLFNFLVAVVFAIVASQVSWFINLYYAYVALVLIPAVSVSIRRLHDMGRSGYWFFIILVPLLGALTLLYFFIQPTQPGKNEYGEIPE